MSKYGWCEEGAVVSMRNGEHKDLPCKVIKIDGAYIYINPIGYDKQLIYETYLGEIYPAAKYIRDEKINKLLDKKEI